MRFLQYPIISVLLFLYACGIIPPKQLYKGQERAPEEIAIIQPESGVYATFYTLKKEENREIPEELGKISDGRTFSLLPGDYKAMVTYNQEIKGYSHKHKKTIVKSRKYSVTPGFMKFTVRAGGKYRLKIEDAGYKKWRPSLIDSSGSVVSKPTKLY